jgi:hypothetical protein
MNYEIDTTAAGSYAQPLDDGATRFCEAHPDEEWEISGVLCQTGLSVNATDGKRHLIAKMLAPVLDMTASIFEALQDFRNSTRP